MAGDATAHDPAAIATQRRRAMRQALIGVALLAVLLLLLPFVGDEERAPESVPSAPAVSSVPEPAATMAVGGIAPAPPAGPAPPVDVPPAPVIEPAPASAPETAPVQAPTDTARDGAGELPAEEAPAVTSPVPERRYPPPPPGNGYMVQLGVFTDTENAAKLLLELAAAGHPVYLQSRVVLGPYPDKAAAQRAQEKIRRERKLDGMIVPPRKP